MRTKTIAKPYEVFMEDVISFCNIACGRFQVPVLFMSTGKTSPETMKLLMIGVGPCCAGMPQWQMQKWQIEHIAALQNSSLFISDAKSYSEAQLNELDLRGAKVVLIDDGSAVPPVEVLDKWAEKNDLNIIVRTDK